MERWTKHRKQLLLAVSFLCLAVFSSTLAASASPSPSPAAAAMRRWWPGFDYYVLALQWPGTICRRTNYCCDSNGCCRSRPLKWFTIHGLWPQYNYGGWPSCCRYTTFNINKILMLIPILEKYWPSLYCGSSSTCFGGRGPFWAHEWEKHGTCAYPIIQDEYDYFSTALYLYSKYNVTKVLRRAGIRATRHRRYAVGHIVAIIEHAFGAMPMLVCKNGSVEELRLCFHKDYQARDCVFDYAVADNALDRRGSCPRYVQFPMYEPYVFATNDTEGISKQVNDEKLAYN